MSFDYTIKIEKNNKVICAFGSKNMAGYDNVQWWQLTKLVTILKNGFDGKDDLINKVEEGTDYFHNTENPYEDCEIIDLDNNTIDMPYFPLFDPSEVSHDECGIDLRIDGDKYYAVYEDGEEYEMPHVIFNRVDLLKAKKVSLDEFLLVAKFVNDLIDKYNDTDFVLNNELIIRFNFA